MEDIVWTKKPGGTAADLWVDLMDPEGWWEAGVKSDGCIHLNQYFNRPFTEVSPTEAADSGYFHICDLDDFILRLQALRAAALEHFGAWPR
jgi:hypothetical protein